MVISLKYDLYDKSDGHDRNIRKHKQGISMSKSFHAIISQLKGKTKEELNDMALDPESIMDELATKSFSKKAVKKKRKANKNSE